MNAAQKNNIASNMRASASDLAKLEPKSSFTSGGGHNAYRGSAYKGAYQLASKQK
jgi:hypothetical protein